VSRTAASGPRYDWTRLTYPRGRNDGGYTDEHGWLVPLPAWHFPGRRSFLAPLAGVRDEPVIVLMSAGGTGKSTALAQEYQALAGTACLIDLKDLAGKPEPAAWLSAQAAMPSPLPEDCWHVLLDGFDEALSLIPEPGLVALRCMAGPASPGVCSFIITFSFALRGAAPCRGIVRNATDQPGALSSPGSGHLRVALTGDSRPRGLPGRRPSGTDPAAAMQAVGGSPVIRIVGSDSRTAPARRPTRPVYWRQVRTRPPKIVEGSSGACCTARCSP
jgi:hypothetical protein